MTKSWDAAEKIVKVYESCKTLEHIRIATNMFMNFKKLYCSENIIDQNRMILKAWVKSFEELKSKC